MSRRLTAWTHHWDQAISAAEGPQERLLAVFDAIETFRASAGPTQWCCFQATASERPAPEEGTSDPVLDLIDQDTHQIQTRLADLAREARCADPSAMASMLLLIYNGVLSSLLRGAPSDPITHARRTAQVLLGSGPDSA